MTERRHFAFLGPYGAAIGMDTENLDDNRKQLTIALAFCCGKDHFEKHIARNILNGRLDKRVAGTIVKQTFQTTYEGVTPNRDVMYPILDIIRDVLPVKGEENTAITFSGGRRPMMGSNVRTWTLVNSCKERILAFLDPGQGDLAIPTTAEFREAAKAAGHDSFGLCGDPKLREAANEVAQI